MTFVVKDIPRPVPRDGNDRPLVIPEGGGKPKALTRVTTFIDCIEDKSALARWGKRMTLVGLRSNRGLLEAAEGLDPAEPKDKRVLDGLAERAVELSGANDKREKGTQLHEYTEFVDRGEPLPSDISPDDLRDMMEYMAATTYLTPVHREVFTVCSPLGVGGTPDGICDYDGPGPDGKPFKARIITDLKTGGVEYGGIKMPAQLSIYSRSKFYDHTLFPAPDREDKKAWDKWKRTVVPEEEAAAAYTDFEVNQDWGLIIHLPAGQAQCTLHWANLNVGWEIAQEALRIRAMRSIKGGLVPWVPYVSTDTLDEVA